MATCLICGNDLVEETDAGIEDIEACIECCDGITAILKEYLSSSPGGYDLLTDIIADDLRNPDGKLREVIKEIVREELK